MQDGVTAASLPEPFSQNRKIIWVEGDIKDHLVPPCLPWAEISSTRAGCLKPHPAWSLPHCCTLLPYRTSFVPIHVVEEHDLGETVEGATAPTTDRREPWGQHRTGLLTNTDSLMGLQIISERKLAEAALPHILCTREWHNLHPTARCPWRKDWQLWYHVLTGRVLLGIHVTGCWMLEAKLSGSASTSGCPGGAATSPRVCLQTKQHLLLLGKCFPPCSSSAPPGSPQRTFPGSR